MIESYLWRRGETSTLGELALVLAKVPRWNGQTTRPWSVLQHLLLCGLLTEEEPALTRIGALTHDVEEALTGDIPYGFKTEEQSKLGGELRAQVQRAVLGLTAPAVAQEVDTSAAYGEAAVLGLPRWLEVFDEPSGADEAELREKAVYGVESLMDCSIREQVFLWEGQVAELLQDPRVVALARRFA